MTRRFRLLRRANAMDDRALNSWWGALVAPFAWAVYRLGAKDRSGRGRWPAYLTFGPINGAVFNRGRQEATGLARPVLAIAALTLVIAVPILVFVWL